MVTDYLTPMRAFSEPTELATVTGVVVAVSRSVGHTFSKQNQPSITLVAGLGVADDAHLGTTVKHRSRVARDPNQPNLRQVHLIHAELHDELAAAGFNVRAGDMGENVTTRGIALLELPTGTRLRIGPDAVVELTGLRNPCTQLDGFHPGLLRAVLDRLPDGSVVRKSGVMSIVLSGGNVEPGDPIEVELPAPPLQRLGVV